MLCSMRVPIHSCCCQASPKDKILLSLSAAGAMLSSDELCTYIFFSAYIIHLGGFGWGVGWANTSLLLRTYFIFIQLLATSRYHLVDAMSQELLRLHGTLCCFLLCFLHNFQLR